MKVSHCNCLGLHFITNFALKCVVFKIVFKVGVRMLLCDIIVVVVVVQEKSATQGNIVIFMFLVSFNMTEGLADFKKKTLL